jgi:hypothetical protein
LKKTPRQRSRPKRLDFWPIGCGPASGLLCRQGQPGSAVAPRKNTFTTNSARAPQWREVRDPEDDVRQHFRDAVKVIMRHGPLGTDFVLCAVGRMAEDILRIAKNSEQDPQFASEWIEYARWVLPGFNGTVTS